MHVRYSSCVCTLALLAGMAVLPIAAQTPKASLHGHITDPSKSSIPGAVVTLTGADQKTKLKRTTDLQGQYNFSDIAAGKYTVSVTRDGFSPFEMQDYQVSGNATLDVPMEVAVANTEVTVKDEAGSQVSVDASSNASALVLRGTDLDSLSDDPDQLQDDLQALAGPSAGPNGGQIYIDGYSNGTLPPKSSIREVRINQNPFSAEFDRLGFGRIEIFTKPGTDKLHGQFMSMFSDNTFNARNPFATERPDFQARFFSGNVTGKLTGKSSFTLNVDHRGIDENALVNAKLLDQNLQPYDLIESAATPHSWWHVVPKVDWQIASNNTLSMRYDWSRDWSGNQGVGGFTLPTMGYENVSTEHEIRVTDTAVLSANAINETRFEYERSSEADHSSGTDPVLQISDVFTTGSAPDGRNANHENYWELQNITSKTSGKHSWKFGGRLRASSLWDSSPANFFGTFVFDTLEQYRTTLVGLNAGLSAAQIRANGGGPSQFTMSAGNPVASLSQTDVGLFMLDDYRWKPNFTLSYGFRYETQNNIRDHADLSPRLGLAWGIDGGGGRSAKTVLRAGFGVFYDRISSELSLAALRNDGTLVQQYVVENPDFYPVVPAPETLTGSRDTAIYQKYSGLRTPYLMQTAVGVDRQLPKNSTMSVTYTFTRGVHQLRLRDINAPLSGGVLPYPGSGAIYEYESGGTMRQQQLIMNFNTRFSRRVSLFGFYTLNYADGDTAGRVSGVGGPGNFPANSYDLHTEWGPTGYDVRHRVFVGGALTAPGKIMFSPFITASTGQPFNIITGEDNNGDGIRNDRPAFANPGDPGAVSTPWGVFTTNMTPNSVIIPRNYGRAPGRFSVNMRMSRSFGFGRRLETAGNAQGGPRMGAGPFGARMHGRGGPGGIFSDGPSGRRFTLTLGVMAHNLFNTVNYGSPSGNLSSPFFGESTNIATGFGASSSSNRRIDVQMRLSF